MNQGIVIASWSGGRDACGLLLDSIGDVPYPIAVVLNDAENTPIEWYNYLDDNYIVLKNTHDGYEIGAIQLVLEKTDWDEFILLQESIEIKNPDIFRKLFEEYPNQSVAYNPFFQMYLGKFRRVILNQLTLPNVRTKVESVRQEEIFTNDYRRVDPETKVFNPNFRDENFYGNWEEKFGRKNLKLEDEYIIKRKGTWAASQL